MCVCACVGKVNTAQAVTSNASAEHMASPKTRRGGLQREHYKLYSAVHGWRLLKGQQLSGPRCRHAPPPAHRSCDAGGHKPPSLSSRVSRGS